MQTSKTETHRTYVCLSQRLEPTQAQALRSKKMHSSAEPVLRVLAHPWLRLNNQTWEGGARDVEIT